MLIGHLGTDFPSYFRQCDTEFEEEMQKRKEALAEQSRKMMEKMAKCYNKLFEEDFW